MLNQHKVLTNLKIGLVGVGYWGKNLVRVFNQLGYLKTICDLDKKILEKTKKEYPNLQITTDFSEILKDKDIKAVVIATPAATHYNLSKRVLDFGKDVFVEKPLALKVKEGEELVKLAQNKKLILMVGHLLLYHPAIIELKKIIKSKELGEMRYIWTNRLNFGKLRQEENVLWSFAPHDISVIIDILKMPKKIRAIGKSYLQKDIPDVTLSILEFKKNQTAHIFVSWLNPFKEQKLSIVGSKAMVIFNDQAKDKLVIHRHKVKWQKNKRENNWYPEAVKAKGERIKIAEREPLVEEAKHFLESVKKRKIPRTDGKEALEVLKVLDICQKSLDKNGESINL